MNPLKLDQLIGHTISYQWGGTIRKGKLIRIKGEVLIIEDIVINKERDIR